MSVDTGVQLGGGGRVALEVPFAHAHAAELKRNRGFGLLRPEHQLRRATTDVHDQERAVRRRQAGCRSCERKARFFRRRSAAPAARPARARRRRRTRRGCGRPARRWWRRRAVAPPRRDRTARGTRAAPRPCARWLPVARTPVTSTPWPSRVMRIGRASSRPASSAISRRTELVPMSTAATSTRQTPCAPMCRFSPISVNSSMRAAASFRKMPCSLLVVVHEPGFFTPR